MRYGAVVPVHGSAAQRPLAGHLIAVVQIVNGVEDCIPVLDLDNRLWRTVPDLLFRPGRLTRAYLVGHRAPQVPPLRLFLVVLVALFLVGTSIGAGTTRSIQMPANQDEAIKKIENDKDIAPEDRRDIVNSIREARAMKTKRKLETGALWLSARIKNAIAHQREFWQAVQNWSERFAVLMLPLSALLLALLFAFNRRFYLFDHIVFSMHSLSFVCLLLMATILLNHYLPLGPGGALLLAAPVHLFAHMRGVYATSVWGTLWRMGLLFIGSAIGATFLVLGLLWVALSAV